MPTKTTKKLSLKQKNSEKHIRSITEFSKHIKEATMQQEKNKKHQDCLFRGQPIDEPLIPRLGRNKGEWRLKKKLAVIEKLIIEEFKRTSLSLVEFATQDDWDVVTIAQHHGLPTRLLDWTTSAFAALWFAVRNPPEKDCEGNERPGVVWIFKPSKEDYRGDLKESGPFSNKKTKIFKPKVIGKRIFAQGGVFTVHQIGSGEKFVPLKRNAIYEGKLIKLTINPKHFAKLRKDLDAYNVNESSLFPDIDGLCKHLKWRHIKMEDEKIKRL